MFTAHTWIHIRNQIFSCKIAAAAAAATTTTATAIYYFTNYFFVLFLLHFIAFYLRTECRM